MDDPYEPFTVDGIVYDRWRLPGVHNRRPMFEIIDDHEGCFDCSGLVDTSGPLLFPGLDADDRGHVFPAGMPL